MKHVRQFRAAAAASLIAVALAGCGGDAAGDRQGPGGEAPAARGVSEDQIKIGAILDLSGPYNVAGVDMRDGMEAYAKWVNDNGGVNGRQISMSYEDNKSDPAGTLAAANKLLLRDEVFALAGVHGAAAFGAIFDLVEREDAISLSLGLSESMYNPVKPNVFVAAVPYAQQMGRTVEYAVEEFGEDIRLAVLAQDDEFGTSGVAGITTTAEALGVPIIAQESFPRGAPDVTAQTRALLRENPDVIACMCIYTQAGQLRKELNDQGAADVKILAPNPSVGAPYFELAGEQSGGMYAADYYSHPGDPGWDEAQEIFAASFDRDPTGFNLFGLVNMAVLVQAIENVDGPPTTESVRSALEEMSELEVPGMVSPVTFGPDDHVAGEATIVYEADPETRTFVAVNEAGVPPGF